MKQHLSGLLAALFVASQMAGCANMDETQRTTATGAAVGAVAGALLGGVTAGGNKTKSAATGAAIGAALGAGGGRAVGCRHRGHAVPRDGRCALRYCPAPGG